MNDIPKISITGIGHEKSISVTHDPKNDTISMETHNSKKEAKVSGFKNLSSSQSNGPVSFNKKTSI
jgi:hypothetical protein